MVLLSWVRERFDRGASQAEPAPPRQSRPAADRGLAVSDNATLRTEHLSLTALVTAHGSPLHVVELDVVEANARAAATAGSFSTVASSYKTNPIPVVLAGLHRNGVRAEVISPFEWWLALEMGNPASDVIYNGPAKSMESMVDAARLGAMLVNANSLHDVDRMADAARTAGTPMRSGVRVSLPHMWGGQFGIDGTSTAIVEAVERSLASPWLDLIAVHAHSGFPLLTAESVERHVTTVLAVIDRIEASTQWTPQILDLGGSAGCPTVQSPGNDNVLTLAEVIAMCERLVTEHCEHTSWDRPSLIFEPGKALTADTQFTLTTVLSTDEVDGRLTAVLDVGIGLAEPMPSEHHDLYNVSNPDGPMRPTVLVGPDSVGDDTLIDAHELPEVRTGDIVLICDTGAYFVPFSRAPSTLRPAIVVADGAQVDVARMREDGVHVHRLDASPVGE